jgi:hypothetical protein
MPKITNQATAERKTVLIDFDGVIHSYKSGWKGVDIIPDEPVEGAIQWLQDMMDKFDVRIFSARCNDENGIIAMMCWLKFWGLPQYYMDRLQYEPGKPSSWMIIDDRAFQFTGHFPYPKTVAKFRPWYYRIPAWNRDRKTA